MSTLQFAVKMEMDGQKYYQEQADNFSDLPISKVFRILAKAEYKHAALIKKFASGEEMNLSDHVSVDDKHVFSDLAPYVQDVSSIPRQLDVYRYAMEIEQKSIDLYVGLKEKSNQKDEKKLLDFLIEQEKSHYALFENLSEMVQRPEDWVEDAEFGNRKEY